MNKKLFGALEDLDTSVYDNEIDAVHVGIPLLIRLFEFAREDATSDEALHRVAERLTAICNDGYIATMADYNDIIAEDAPAGKSPEASMEALNNAKCEIEIELNDVDAANALTKALKSFADYAGQGGDAELFINHNDEMKLCGAIGHDVRITEVELKIEHDEVKEEE